MSEAQPLPEADRVSLDGLDNVFADVHEAHDVAVEHAGDAGDNPEELTVAQAAKLLSKDERAILSMIRRGKICAVKDKKSRDWMVSGQCVRSMLGEAGTELIKHAQAENIEAHAMWDIGAEGFRSMLEKLHTTQQQLNDANYRIGYLESQVVAYTEKVQLLPDLQAQADRAARAEQEADELRLKLAEVTADLQKARQSGWTRFCGWLTGQGA